MTHANLLHATPGRARDAASRRPVHAGVIGASILGATACGLAACWATLWQDAARVERELVQVRADLSRMRDVRARAEATEQMAGNMDRRMRALDRLRAAQRGAPLILEAIGRAVPADCWLTAVLDDGSNAVRIEGASPALSSLFAFVGRLETAGVFPGGVEVIESHVGKTVNANIDVIAFTLHAVTRPDGQPSTPVVEEAAARPSAAAP